QRELAAEGGERGGIGEGGKDRVVVVVVDDDGDTLVVLGGAAQHGGTTDIDVFDGFLEVDILLGDGLLERVKVHHDEIDQVDAVGLGGREVVGLVATA